MLGLERIRAVGLCLKLMDQEVQYCPIVSGIQCSCQDFSSERGLLVLVNLLKFLSNLVETLHRLRTVGYLTKLVST